MALDPNCCATVWWCTPDGPIASTDGTKPAEAIDGPFRSEVEALVVCPIPPVPDVGVPCGGCAPEFQMPGDGIYINFSAQVGVGTPLPNSVFLPLTPPGGCGSVDVCYILTDAGITYRILGFCAAVPEFVLVIALKISGTTDLINNAPTPAGWLASFPQGGTEIQQRVACGDTFDAGQNLGTVSFSGGFAGTAQMSLST